MTFTLSKLPIRYQLMWWFSFAIGFIILTAGLVIESLIENNIKKTITGELTSSTIAIQKMIETALDVAVCNHLRGIAEKNVAILNSLQQDVLSGKMTLNNAQQFAKKILLSQPIGETGYIYVLSGKGRVAVHPHTKMQGRDMANHWLAKTQMAQREGYLEYDWKNPGEDKDHPKALYMAYFEPWDWIVSVSSYRDEFQFLFNINDVRPGVQSFRFGKTGYPFILDSNGQFLIHPVFSGNVTDKDVPATGRHVFEKMLAEKNGQLTYLWKEPDSNKLREKLVSFHYIPELKWIVAASANLDEINAPVYTLRKIMVATLFFTLLLILPISFYLGSLITNPLTRLAGKMNAANDGNFDIRAEEDAHGEIGDLARYFNSYMASLQLTHTKLHEEIKERAQAEIQIKLFAKVYENTLEGISITDEKGQIIAINSAFSTITGYSEEEVLGQNPRVLKSDRHDKEFYSRMWKRITTKGQWVGEIWNRRKNGEAYPEILSISSIRDDEGEITHFVAVFHDISEMKLQQEQIKHQAYHDALTGLPNRLLARDRLTMAIANAKRNRCRLAVFFLDLDNFKNVNDSLGHATGDLLLQKVAKRLQHLLREEDTVARLGGDEFLILVTNIQSNTEITALSNRLLAGFRKPIIAENHELFVTISIGIAFYPEDGTDEGTLIKNADVAMYQSKSRGKNKHHFFTSELSEHAARRFQLETELRQALDRNEFTLHFQPQVEPKNNQVTGVEALVRWIKQDGTLVSPIDFIPLAEETGLIIPIGKFVLKESCKAIMTLHEKGYSQMSIAVNLSPLQFRQNDIVECVLNTLKNAGVSPSHLELEITESTMMTDLEDSVIKLNILRKNGISIAIDDFGTGYSSLYYLKTFPISTLKIDRSFIKDITSDNNNAQIVETIVLMAKNLELDVVAEGVETKEQLEMMNSYGCDMVQGYYYSRPLPLDQLLEFLMPYSCKDAIKNKKPENII